MVGIGMDCEKVLVFALEEFFAKFLAYFQSSFRRDLTRLKALNKVLREDSIQARSSCTDCFKISACLCRIRAAPVCEDQSAAVCFFRVGRYRLTHLTSVDFVAKSLVIAKSYPPLLDVHDVFGIHFVRAVRSHGYLIDVCWKLLPTSL